MWRPFPRAALAGSLYFIFCTIYILVSGRLAAEHAGSLENLRQIETIKGSLFILVSSLVFVLFIWILLKRLAIKESELMAHHLTLLTMERRAMTGSLASSVAHDMNNILTVGCASAEMLMQTKGLNAEQTELASEIRGSFERITDLTRRLSAMGRAGTKGDLQPGDLRAVLEEEVAFAGHHDRLKLCQIKLVAPEAVPMRLCAPMIQHMMVNLLLNASDATQGRGLIEVRLKREVGMAILEVHDNGPGIPADQKDRVFDAFFTTKSTGHGLGLLSVKAAAQMHRGRATVGDSPLGGACFKITMPLESAV